jgi:hypothetical protein
MTTYQHAAPAPGRSGGIDVAAWALVALVVAVVCAGAGWALASRDVASPDDVARNTDLASREGLMRGAALGYRQGADQGRRQATLRTRAAITAERRAAARDGYSAGYAEGRSQAGDPDAFSTGTLGGAGAYPTAGYEDILASGLFGGDAPGYSESAYDSLGYGTGATMPYLGSTATSTVDTYGTPTY